MNWIWQGKNDVVFKTESERKKEKIKKGIIVFFAVAIVLILFAAFFIMWSYDFKLSNVISDSGGTLSTGSEKDALPNVSGKADFMIFVTDDNSENVLALSVVRFDMSKKEITILPVSVQDTNLKLNGKTVSVIECYRHGGAVELSKSLEKYLGMSIERYFGCLEGNVESIAANFDNLTFDFEKSVALSKDGDTVRYEKGKQTILDDNIVKLLTYNGYSEKLKLQGDILESMFKQYFNENTAENSSLIFTNMIGLCDSNISVVDFGDNKNSIVVLSSDRVKKTYKVTTDTDVFRGEK